MNTPRSAVCAAGRFALCFVGFVVGLFQGRAEEGIALQARLSVAVDVGLVVLGPVVAYFGFRFIMEVQSRSRYSAEQWTIPTWKSCWLNLGDLAHSFHAAAFGGLALGAGLLTDTLVFGHGRLADAIAVITGSLGVLVAVKQCPKLFPHKYARLLESTKAPVKTGGE